MSTRMKRSAPAQKVTAGVIGGAITTVLVFVLNTTVLKGSPLPPHVVAAITTIITFAVSYITPPSPKDEVITD